MYVGFWFKMEMKEDPELTSSQRHCEPTSYLQNNFL